MKDRIQIASYSVLLGGSTFLGFFGRPTEMGLSILAGAIGLAFANIDKISKFKGAGFEAEMREKIEAVIEKETEPNPGIKCEAFGTDETAQTVIKALKNKNYTWRHAAGIVQETKLTETEVENTLKWLEQNTLGKKSYGVKGLVWTLTPKGREVFKNIK